VDILGFEGGYFSLSIPSVSFYVASLTTASPLLNATFKAIFIKEIFVQWVILTAQGT
jgi:hypothetical protein